MRKIFLNMIFILILSVPCCSHALQPTQKQNAGIFSRKSTRYFPPYNLTKQYIEDAIPVSSLFKPKNLPCGNQYMGNLIAAIKKVQRHTKEGLIKDNNGKYMTYLDITGIEEAISPYVEQQNKKLLKKNAKLKNQIQGLKKDLAFKNKVCIGTGIAATVFGAAFLYKWLRG